MEVYGVCLVTTASNLAAANQLAELLGYGPATFSVPLSADAQQPATHYGCRTWATQPFIDLLAGVQQGQLPDVPGMEAATVLLVAQGLQFDYQPQLPGDDPSPDDPSPLAGLDALEHWLAFLSLAGLQRIEVESVEVESED